MNELFWFHLSDARLDVFTRKKRSSSREAEWLGRPATGQNVFRGSDRPRTDILIFTKRKNENTARADTDSCRK